MNKILKYLLYSVLLSTIIGHLFSLPLEISGVNVYLTDLIIGLICLVWLLNQRRLINLIKKDSIVPFFALFVLIAFLSLLFSPIALTFSEKIISFMYLFRFTAYFSIYLTVIHLIKSRELTFNSLINWLGLIGIILAAIGWLQYFLYPDLRNLFYLGWDPHYKRIFGSFFDPNYFGLMMVLTLVALFSQPNKILVWFSRIFIFISLMFTYSRSSYLALLAAALFYSIFKKKYFLITGAFMILILSALILPRPGGVGVKLERIFSIEQRIENWKQGAQIFANNPLLGIGFNTIRFAKKQYGFGGEDLSVSHSGAGFDNSFLFVAVTTGLIGIIFYLLLLKQIFVSGNLLVKTSLVAAIIHSLFLNSLFFPWVMLWMWILIPLKAVTKNR